MDWLIQSLASQLVWEILLIIGGGAILGLLRNRIPEHAPVIGYAVVGATCIAILIYTITGRGLMYKKAPELVTSDNVEENIKVWADHVAMSLARQPPVDAKFFSYVGRAQGSSDPIEIFRAKEKPGYLQFKATLNASPQHQEILAKLSQHDYGRVLNQIAMEVSRLRINSDIAFPVRGAARGPMSIFLQKGVPIPDLNEGYFLQSFDEVSGAVVEVRATVNLALDTPPILARPLVPQ